MDTTEQTLIAIARKVWDATVAKDADFYQDFLVDEAIRINGFGIASKAMLIDQLKQPGGPTVTDVALEDINAIVLTPESALLTYKATIHVVRDGKELVMSDYVTTALVKRAGQWKGALQQHTPIQSPPPK